VYNFTNPDNFTVKHKIHRVPPMVNVEKITKVSNIFSLRYSTHVRQLNRRFLKFIFKKKILELLSKIKKVQKSQISHF
jgi:hypothetical protein